MTAAFLVLFGLRLHGVVDQIDAGWAAVEWQGEALGFVRVEMLPDGVREGDPVLLRERARRGALVHLPTEVAPRGERTVRASLHPAGAKTAPRRTR